MKKVLAILAVAAVVCGLATTSTQVAEFRDGSGDVMTVVVNPTI